MQAYCTHGVPLEVDCLECEPRLDHDPGFQAFDENAADARRHGL